MKVLLANPQLHTWSPNVYVPLGLCYIAAVLEQAGHEVEILDLNAQSGNLAKHLKGVDVAGITGMITEYDEVIRLSREVASCKTRLVLGGAMAVIMPHQLREVAHSDAVVVGEGERSISILMNDIARGIKPIYESEIIKDMDSIPFPARHLLNMKKYNSNFFETFGISGLGKIRSTTMITSRGCPYKCTFCFKALWGNIWRGRSAGNIIAEMKQLHEQYDINGFVFIDDTFVLNSERVWDFCRQLSKSNLPFYWYCNGRINLMTKELLEAMYAAGCRGIAYGIESGNQDILDAVKKGITIGQVKQVVEWTKQAGIHVTGYFVVGLPGDCKKTIRETLAFAEMLDLDFYGFSLFTPLQGTEIYDSVVQSGLVKQSVEEWSSHVNINLTDCSDKELLDYSREAFKKFYLEKRFGKQYLCNAAFWKQSLMVLASLWNVRRMKELTRYLLVRGKRDVPCD